MRRLIFLVLLTLSVGPTFGGANTWSSLGPWGGSILSIAFGPEEHVVFAATAGGLFRSRDDGGTWEGVKEAVRLGLGVALVFRSVVLLRDCGNGERRGLS